MRFDIQHPCSRNSYHCNPIKYINKTIANALCHSLHKIQPYWKVHLRETLLLIRFKRNQKLFNVNLYQLSSDYQRKNLYKG